MPKKSNYHCGIDNEKRVARKLKRMGASKVIQSPGSRGAADLTAIFPSGRKLMVQVKSSCVGNNAKSLSSKEKKRLAIKSTKNKATAVVATVDGRGINLKYLKSKQKVK